MKWKRIKPGLYESGAYLVERWVTSGVVGWYVSGPGLDESHDTKTRAQQAAQKANAHG